jgi:hypothetical protein
MITPEQTEARLRAVSQMRQLILELREAALAAHRRGEIPIAPLPDVRSDPEHWRALMREREGR